MLGNVTLGGGDVPLAQTAKVYKIAVRLVRCIYDYVKIRAIENKERFYQALVSGLVLMKCLEVRMWENSPRMLSQLPKIGVASVRSLAAAGIGNFDQILAANPRDLEKVHVGIVG